MAVLRRATPASRCHLLKLSVSSAYRTEFGIGPTHDATAAVALAEAGLIRKLRPDWNTR